MVTAAVAQAHNSAVTPPSPGATTHLPTHSLSTRSCTYSHLVVLVGWAKRDDELHDAEAPEDEQLACSGLALARWGSGSGWGTLGSCVEVRVRMSDEQLAEDDAVDEGRHLARLALGWGVGVGVRVRVRVRVGIGARGLG